MTSRIVVQTDSSAHIADAWYLVANRNNLTIKILNTITVGEAENGLLVLDSRVDSERWFTLEVDPSGCLNVIYQDPGCRMICPERWVMDTAGAVLPRCTLLALPNNQLYVSQQLLRGVVEQHVDVERIENAPGADISPVPEPVPVETSVVPEQEPETETEPETAQVETAEPETVEPVAAVETGAEDVVSETSESVHDDNERVAAALNEIVLTEDVLERMLSALEAEDAEQLSLDMTSEVLGEALPDDNIPLLQDVADVYVVAPVPQLPPAPQEHQEHQEHQGQEKSVVGAPVSEPEEQDLLTTSRLTSPPLQARDAHRTSRPFIVAMGVVLLLFGAVWAGLG